jgi:hypothetical protein
VLKLLSKRREDMVLVGAEHVLQRADHH